MIDPKLNIQVSADITGLKKAMADLNKEITNAQQNIKQSASVDVGNQEEEIKKKQKAVKELASEEIGYVKSRKALEKEAEDAQERAQKALNRTRYEYFQLGQQVQDLGVQIAGGQNPFLALLQQGSQLTAIYGGFGAALKGVVQAAKSVVNPMAGAALGAGILAYSIYKLEKDTVSFNKSIVLTNNFANITKKEFEDLAIQVSDSTGISVTRVKEYQSVLINTGAVSKANFVDMSKFAVEFERATGKSVEQVTKDIETLAKDPVQFMRQYGAQFAFLTIEQKKYVETLVKVGETEKAAAYLRDQWMDKFSKQSEEYQTNIEKMTDRLGKFVDLQLRFQQFLGIVREIPLPGPALLDAYLESFATKEEKRAKERLETEQKLNQVIQKRAEAEKYRKQGRSTFAYGTLSDASFGIEASISRMDQDIKSYQEKIKQIDSIQSEAEKRRQEEADKIQKNKQDEDKRLLNESLKGPKLQAQFIQIENEASKERNKLLEARNILLKEFEDISGPEKQNIFKQIQQNRRQELENEIKSIEKRNAVLRSTVTLVNGIISDPVNQQNVENQVEQNLQKIKDIRSQIVILGQDTNQQLRKLFEEEKLRVGGIADETSKQVQDAILSLNAYREGLEEFNKEMDQNLAKSMGEDQFKAEQKLFQLRVDNLRKLMDEEISKARLTGRYTEESLKERQDQYDQLLNKATDTFNKIQQLEKDKIFNPETGIKTAIQNYQKELEKGGKNAEDATNRVIGTMEDAFQNMFMNLSWSWKKIIDSMLAEVIRLQVVKPLVASMFGSAAGQSIMSGIFGSAGASSGTTGGAIIDAGGGPIGPVVASAPTVIINNTIGSVASQEDVIRGMQTVRRQIATDVTRSKIYGGGAYA